MHIISGIIIGVILGITGAIGGTLYGLSSSNTVGMHHNDASHFIPDDSCATFHVKQDTCKHKRHSI